jgi:hypothetical protein
MRRLPEPLRTYCRLLLRQRLGLNLLARAVVRARLVSARAENFAVAVPELEPAGSRERAALVRHPARRREAQIPGRGRRQRRSGSGSGVWS